MWVVLFFFLAIGGIVWVFLREYRKKTMQWEAASKERFDQIFAEQAVRPAAVMPEARAPAAPAVTALKPAIAPAVVAERFLGQPETLVYFLLRTGLPDHAVFAKVPLDSVLAAPGAASAGGVVQRMAQQRLDFVVCDRNMHVAAVVQLRAPGAPDVGVQSHGALESLRKAGVRVIEIDAAHTPRRDTIRQVVLGQQAEQA